MKKITSTSNKLIKQIELLSKKSKERKSTGLFLTEGVQEVQQAIEGGYQFKTVLVCAEILKLDQNKADFETYIRNHFNLPREVEIIEVDPMVYQKIAYRGDTEGIVALTIPKDHNINNLKLSEAPLILVAESPEKPGNIGAILRTADAAGIDAVIIANPLTDLYNPNVVRSSVGSIFNVQVATATTNEIINYLNNLKIPMYAATLQSSERYDLVDYKRAAAIVLGTESTGLNEEFRTAATMNIIIPMNGVVDSMNLSVSAAIIVFEAVRQRNFNKD